MIPQPAILRVNGKATAARPKGAGPLARRPLLEEALQQEQAEVREREDVPDDPTLPAKALVEDAERIFMSELSGKIAFS